METLKARLTSSPALVAVDYSESAREITLAVDVSLDGWGAVLM